jgi:hypothetical protein
MAGMDEIFFIFALTIVASTAIAWAAISKSLPIRLLADS